MTGTLNFLLSSLPLGDFLSCLSSFISIPEKNLQQQKIQTCCQRDGSVRPECDSHVVAEGENWLHRCVPTSPHAHPGLCSHTTHNGKQTNKEGRLKGMQTEQSKRWIRKTDQLKVYCSYRRQLICTQHSRCKWASWDPKQSQLHCHLCRQKPHAIQSNSFLAQAYLFLFSFIFTHEGNTVWTPQCNLHIKHNKELYILFPLE